MLREINTKLNAFEIYTIFKDENDSFILDSAMDPEKLGRYSFISSNPFKKIKAKDSKTNPLDDLEEELKNYQGENDTHLPFVGGAVGYLSYDLGNYMEKLPKIAEDDMNVYDLYFGFYNWVVVVDHLENKTYIATPNLDRQKEESLIDEIERKIKNAEQNGIDPICYETKNIKPIKLKSNFTKKGFEDAVQKVRDYIRSGDIYQANLTQRFSGKTTLSSYELYRDLRRFSPAPFGAFLNFDKFHILSNSPERFIKCVDRKLETRPIKGTRPRGKDEADDLRLREELVNSEKDRAELLMIVDLERNDLSRVSKVGTVKDEYNAVDVIKATFPGGSITGAPKIRSMEIIEELEPTKRNVYTGSIGYIGFDGNMDLNIAIRTIVKENEDVYFQVGGGMTWGSNPSDEYQETLDKAVSIMKALRGYYEE